MGPADLAAYVAGVFSGLAGVLFLTFGFDLLIAMLRRSTSAVTDEAP